MLSFFGVWHESVERQSGYFAIQDGEARTATPEEREVARVREKAIIAQDALMHGAKHIIIDFEHCVAVFTDEVMMGRVAH